MDIQKIKELALANGFKLKEQASGNVDLNVYVYDFANAIEQAAKAQVPEGFVLVKKEPCAYLVKHKLWSKNSQPEIFPACDFVGDGAVEKEKLTICIPLYKGMDEAQEPAND